LNLGRDRCKKVSIGGGLRKITVVQRRLELLKMEGLGFNQAEIVKQLSEKYQCSARAVYYDFARRPGWQPTLLQLADQEKVLLKVINRYEQIYRQAAFKCLTADNENVWIGALKVMLAANSMHACCAIYVVVVGIVFRTRRYRYTSSKSALNFRMRCIILDTSILSTSAPARWASRMRRSRSVKM